MEHIMEKNFKFQRYQDLILFEEKSFLKKFNCKSREDFLQSLKCSNNEIMEQLQKKLSFKRAGFIGNICDDNYRSPMVFLFYDKDYKIQLIRPIDPWVIHCDNGIKYTFDVTRTMFCKGNIKEKLRLAKIDCTEQIVVDLFSGIGYFSLIFAVHCNAKHVYCCEWNPDALEALRRNIQLNKMEHRMTICPGDNRLVCPINIAHRVQMGLIPTSLNSLDVACRSLKIYDNNNDENANFTLHVHENLNYFDKIKSIKDRNCKRKEIILEERKQWAEDVQKRCLNMLNIIHNNNGNQKKSPFNVKIGTISRIKQYAPYIDHMVVDIHCSLL